MKPLLKETIMSDPTPSLKEHLQNYDLGDYENSMELDELSYRVRERRQHEVVKYVLNCPVEDTFYNPDNIPLSEIRHPIYWMMPGSDHERPKMKGCGPMRVKGSSGDYGLSYVACSNDPEHFIKGIDFHCWSLACSECMNDAANREGSRKEEQFTAYRLLMEKRGQDPGKVSHWVVSPDQNYAKRAVQTLEGYSNLRKTIEKDLRKVGAVGGIVIFHPWRFKDYHWEFAPHFHIILYGFLDTDMFREMHEGWVIKKIHADQEMESISDTVSYLFTHAGIGIVTKDVEEVNYIEKLFNFLLPGNSDDNYRKDNGVNGLYGAAKGKPFRFTDEDYADQVMGKGKMVGDLSGIDWFEFTVRPLSYRITYQYFGELSNRKLKTIAVEAYEKENRCDICGNPIRRYGGLCDTCGQQSVRRFENKIRILHEDTDLVKSAVRRMREEFGGLKLSEITPSIPLAVSKEEIVENIDYPKHRSIKLLRSDQEPEGPPVQDAAKPFSRPTDA